MTNPNDNPNIANTTEASVLPRFSELNGPDQLSVKLRAEGKSYKQVAVGLKSEYGIDRSDDVIRQWFSPSNDGRLREAYLEYVGMLAEESMAEGRNLLKRGMLKAVSKIIQKIDSADEAVGLRASGMVVDKFVPDANRFDIRIEEVLPGPRPVSEALQASIERQRRVIEAGEAALAKEAENE